MVRGRSFGFPYLLALLLLLAACGRVGDPLPPFIRIPEPVHDLGVQQNGRELVLTWTNPAKNIDGSAATDLSRVHIRSNDSVIATVGVGAPAQMQSHAISIGSLSAERRTFSVQVETARGKLSALSNAVSIMPVEVPGRVTQLHAVVDQRRVMLDWQPPVENPTLADGYAVTRTEPPQAPIVVMETRYEDNRYMAGSTYTYQVTAIRRFEGRIIPGAGSELIMVLLQDKTPPQPPSGIDVIASDTGAFVTWTPNIETDLAGYHLFRSEKPDRDFQAITDRPVSTNAFFDPEYRRGLYYAASALDDSGNESRMSVPFRAP